MSHETNIDFLLELEQIVQERISNLDTGSYTAKLVASGIERVAQKLGEEAIEVALASVAQNRTDALRDEVADLVYHLIVLLAVKGIALTEITELLTERHRGRTVP